PGERMPVAGAVYRLQPGTFMHRTPATDGRLQPVGVGGGIQGFLDGPVMIQAKIQGAQIQTTLGRPVAFAARLAVIGDEMGTPHGARSAVRVWACVPPCRGSEAPKTPSVVG